MFEQMCEKAKKCARECETKKPTTTLKLFMILRFTE